MTRSHAPFDVEAAVRGRYRAAASPGYPNRSVDGGRR